MVTIIPLSPGTTQPAVHTIRTRLGEPSPRSFPLEFTMWWQVKLGQVSPSQGLGRHAPTIHRAPRAGRHAPTILRALLLPQVLPMIPRALLLPQGGGCKKSYNRKFPHYLSRERNQVSLGDLFQKTALLLGRVIKKIDCGILSFINTRDRISQTSQLISSEQMCNISIEVL